MIKRFLPVVGLLMMVYMTDAQVFGEFVINQDTAGSFPSGLTVFNNKLYFSATDSTNGYEPWVTDGNNGQVIADIFPGAGSSFPQNFTVDSNLLFFQADDFTHGAELWVTDGNTTQLVKDIYVGQNPSQPQNLFVFNHKLFFQADDGEHGSELWSSDGTSNGTQLFADINQANNDTAASFPSGFTIYNGKMYFVADDGVHGNELWVTDGTQGGTSIVKDIWAGSTGSMPAGLTVFNGKLYFNAADSLHGSELWVTDGSANGTQLVLDINPGYQSANPQGFTVYNNQLIFQADDGTHGAELWSTDGTVQGTQLVSDILQGPSGSYPSAFFVYQGKLFFNADDSIHGAELWRTDGTGGGTVLFKDLNPGAYSSDPGYFIVYHTNLYFIAQPDSVSGAQMFITDGTANGTQVIMLSNSPLNPLGATDGFTLFNNGLAFNAYYDAFNGEQLWLYNDGPSAIVEVKNTQAFNLFPNPCQDRYTLSGFKPGDTYNITLADVTGRIVQSQQLMAEDKNIQFIMPPVSEGIYLIEVRNGPELSTLRLIKSSR